MIKGQKRQNLFFFIIYKKNIEYIFFNLHIKK
jgi:hypothetical protein